MSDQNHCKQHGTNNCWECRARADGIAGIAAQVEARNQKYPGMIGVYMDESIPTEIKGKLSGHIGSDEAIASIPTEPKQFWVINYRWACYAEGKTYVCHDWNVNEKEVGETTHVIEYSAYQSLLTHNEGLLKEVEELRYEIKTAANNLEYDDDCDCCNNNYPHLEALKELLKPKKPKSSDSTADVALQKHKHEGNGK